MHISLRTSSISDRRPSHGRRSQIALCSLVLLCVVCVPIAHAQSPVKEAKAGDYSKEPWILERVVTKVVFENDGTYTAETTSRARVQSQAGVQQFGVLNFPYASAISAIDIVYVRVIKPDSRVVETPAENILDMPAEITRQAPFYSDLKEKQVAVKGLEIGDGVEYQYRVVVNKPLDPGQFWFSNNFFTGGICLQEEFEISVPRDRYVMVKSPKVQPTTTERGVYKVYDWKTANLTSAAEKKDAKPADEDEIGQASVEITSFRDWNEVGQWFRNLVAPRAAQTPQIRAKADELTRNAKTWDTLGWVNFRMGHLDQAEKFLCAAWSLTQERSVADHLQQVYEKEGKKRGVPSDAMVLQELRTVKLGKLAKKHASAEFYLLFAPGPKVVDVKFISGSEELSDAGKTLAAAKFQVPFPEDGDAQIIRRGILDCEPELPGCVFALIPLNSVRSVK
jgi:hypothetical protein